MSQALFRHQTLLEYLGTFLCKYEENKTNKNEKRNGHGKKCNRYPCRLRSSNPNSFLGYV